MEKKGLTAQEFWELGLKAPRYEPQEYAPRVYAADGDGFYLEMQVGDVKTTSKWRRKKVSKDYMLGLRDWLNEILPGEENGTRRT